MCQVLRNVVLVFMLASYVCLFLNVFQKLYFKNNLITLEK